MNWSPASEREALAMFLDKQRDILVRKIDGVTDEDAHKTPTASSLSLLGILKHCALWERRWFQIIVAGRTFRGEWPEVKSNWKIDDFAVGPDDTVRYWLAKYRDQVTESRRIVANRDLDTPCAYAENSDTNLRRVLVHHVEEVARHAGRADIIRETIDGSTGE